MDAKQLQSKVRELLAKWRQDGLLYMQNNEELNFGGAYMVNDTDGSIDDGARYTYGKPVPQWLKDTHDKGFVFPEDNER